MPKQTFADLWALAGKAPGWRPTRVAMGRDVAFKGGGTEWLAEFHVQVDQRGLDAGVLLVPSRPSRSRAVSPVQKLARYRFLIGVGRMLERAGFKGDVQADCGAGVHGTFSKTLANVAEAEQVIKQIDGFKFPSARQAARKR